MVEKSICLPYNLTMPHQRKWTEHALRDAAKTSRSIREVLGKLGLRQAGGNYAQMQRYINQYSIDISHFKGRGWNRGLNITCNPGRPLRDILKKGVDYQSFKLKRRLFREKLKPQECEECGWAKTTPEGYLPLELDHINGDRFDNRIENLRILCPNCHSLKPTHRGRNVQKRNKGR